MTTDEQLNDLRFRWLLAKKKNDTQGMKIIEMRAKLLKAKPPEVKPRIDRIKEVMDIFTNT